MNLLLLDANKYEKQALARNNSKVKWKRLTSEIRLSE
jgi:hypothetical protein